MALSLTRFAASLPSIDPFSAILCAGMLGLAAISATNLVDNISEDSAATRRCAAMTNAPTLDARRRAAAVILFHSTADELPRISTANRACVDEAVRIAY